MELISKTKTEVTLPTLLVSPKESIVLERSPVHELAAVLATAKNSYQIAHAKNNSLPYSSLYNDSSVFQFGSPISEFSIAHVRRDTNDMASFFDSRLMTNLTSSLSPTRVDDSIESIPRKPTDSEKKLTSKISPRAKIQKLSQIINTRTSIEKVYKKTRVSSSITEPDSITNYRQSSSVDKNIEKSETQKTLGGFPKHYYKHSFEMIYKKSDEKKEIVKSETKKGMKKTLKVQKQLSQTLNTRLGEEPSPTLKDQINKSNKDPLSTQRKEENTKIMVSAASRSDLGDSATTPLKKISIDKKKFLSTSSHTKSEEIETSTIRTSLNRDFSRQSTNDMTNSKHPHIGSLNSQGSQNFSNYLTNRDLSQSLPLSTPFERKDTFTEEKGLTTLKMSSGDNPTSPPKANPILISKDQHIDKDDDEIAKETESKKEIEEPKEVQNEENKVGKEVRIPLSEGNEHESPQTKHSSPDGRSSTILSEKLPQQDQGTPSRKGSKELSKFAASNRSSLTSLSEHSAEKPLPNIEDNRKNIKLLKSIMLNDAKNALSPGMAQQKRRSSFTLGRIRAQANIGSPMNSERRDSIFKTESFSTLGHVPTLNDDSIDIEYNTPPKHQRGNSKSGFNRYKRQNSGGNQSFDFKDTQNQKEEENPEVKRIKAKINFKQKKRLKHNKDNFMRTFTIMKNEESCKNFLDKIEHVRERYLSERNPPALYHTKSEEPQDLENKNVDFSTLLKNDDETPHSIGSKGTFSRAISTKFETPYAEKITVNIIPPIIEESSVADLDTPRIKDTNSIENPTKYEFRLDRFEIKENEVNEVDFAPFANHDEMEEKDYDKEVFLGTFDQINVRFPWGRRDIYFSSDSMLSDFLNYYDNLIRRKHPFTIKNQEDQLQKSEKLICSEPKGEKENSKMFSYDQSPVWIDSPSSIIYEDPEDEQALKEFVHSISRQRIIRSKQEELEFQNQKFIHDELKYESDPSFIANNTYYDGATPQSIKTNFIFQKKGKTILSILEEKVQAAIFQENSHTIWDYLALNQLNLQKIKEDDNITQIAKIMKQTTDHNLEFCRKLLFRWKEKLLTGNYEGQIVLKKAEGNIVVSVSTSVKLLFRAILT